MALPRLLTVAAFVLQLAAIAQPLRIEYRWLNFPCSEILNCDAGCSACNMPEATGGTLIGTNAAWLGVQTCPLPVTTADNAVYTAGWTAEPTPDKSVVFNALATSAVRLDSIRFRHKIYQDGPQRVKVLFTNNLALPLQEIADVEVPDAWTNITLNDLGPIVAPEGNPFAAFQIRFQPYQNNTGGWALDELVISASPLNEAQTGISEAWLQAPATKGPTYDIMGRPVGRDRAPGMYQRQGKRVVQLD
ncbi:MAG: hypothetical protein JNM49_04415 [Flavobacteriales bacterium]|nr:hypothetical protein [Flavobacteriales bacterium]